MVVDVEVSAARTPNPPPVIMVGVIVAPVKSGGNPAGSAAQLSAVTCVINCEKPALASWFPRL